MQRRRDLRVGSSVERNLREPRLDVDDPFEPSTSRVDEQRLELGELKLVGDGDDRKRCFVGGGKHFSIQRVGAIEADRDAGDAGRFESGNEAPCRLADSGDGCRRGDDEVVRSEGAHELGLEGQDGASDRARRAVGTSGHFGVEDIDHIDHIDHIADFEVSPHGAVLAASNEEPQKPRVEAAFGSATPTGRSDDRGGDLSCPRRCEVAGSAAPERDRPGSISEYRVREAVAMMWFDGGWAWMWFAMVPMMALVWALIAMVVIPWARNGRTGRPRRSSGSTGASPPATSAWTSTAPGGPSSSTAHDQASPPYMTLVDAMLAVAFTVAACGVSDSSGRETGTTLRDSGTQMRDGGQSMMDNGQQMRGGGQAMAGAGQP